MLHNIDQEENTLLEDSFRSYQLLFAKYIYESGARQYGQQQFRQEYKAILGEELLGQAETPVIESFETDCQQYTTSYVEELYGTGRVNKARLLDEQQQLRLGDAVIKQLGKAVRQKFHSACDVYRDLYASDLRDDGQLDDVTLVAEQKRLGLGRSIVEAIASTEKSAYTTDAKDYRQLVSQTMHQTGTLESDAVRSFRIQFSFGPVLLEQIHRDVTQEFRDHRATYEQQFLHILRHNGAITQAEQQQLHELRQTLGNLNARLCLDFEQSAIRAHEQNVTAYAAEARQVIEQFTTGNLADATNEEREALQALSHWYDLSPAIAAQIEQTIRTELSVERQTQLVNVPTLTDAQVPQATTDALQIDANVVQIDASQNAVNTKVDIATDIQADIATDIQADIATDIQENIATDIQADIATDIQADIATDIQADIATDIQADIATDIQENVVTDIQADIATDIQENVVTDIQENVVTDIQADIATDTQADIATDIQENVVTDIQADIATDTQAEIATDTQVDIEIDTQADIATDIQADMKGGNAGLESGFEPGLVSDSSVTNPVDLDATSTMAIPETTQDGALPDVLDNPEADQVQEPLSAGGKSDGSNHLWIWGTGLIAGALLIGGAIASSRNQQSQPAPSAVDLQSNTVQVSQSRADLSTTSPVRSSTPAAKTVEMTTQGIESLTTVQLLIQDHQVVTALNQLANVPTTDQTAAEIESILRQVGHQAETYYHQGSYKEATAVVKAMNRLFPNQPTTSQAVIASREWQTQWHSNLATLKIAQDALDRHEYDGAIAEAKKVSYPGLKTEVDRIIAAAIDGKQTKNDIARE